MNPNSTNQKHPSLFPLGELARRSAEKFGEAIVFRHWQGDLWREYSYRELNDMANGLARWLVNAGLRKSDRVGILGENCPEWSIAYLGILSAGGVVVPIDNLLPPAGVMHILQDSGTKFLFASRKQWQNLVPTGVMPLLNGCINLSTQPLNGVMQFETVVLSGATLPAVMPQSDLDEMASILYTSGTTGHSKGVMLSHRNIISNVAGASQLIPLGIGDTFLSVLPVHHSLECTAGFLLPVYTGSSITYARSMKSNELMSDIHQTNVTILVGVPILFEKMMAGIIKGVKKKGKATALLFTAMMKAAKVQDKAGKLLFRKIRQKAGFGSIKYFVSGGGPLDPEVGRFFLRFGIKLLQGYGMTETSPITHVNPPNKIKVETVGRTLLNVECRIGEMAGNGIGEVEIRGSNVFMGYYNNQNATAAVMTEDGWLKTGDLGIIDKDGYLQLKGRKKNIIVTGGGKNIYPEEIEFYLNRQRFIAESLVLGATRESGYGEDVGALIYPDQEQLELLREERQGRAVSPEELYGIIQNAVNEASRDLADYKRVRKFKIINGDFEKTSSKKIKRYLYSADMLNR